MISIYREHTDKVNRERIKNYIEQGVRCQYTYTHYTPSGEPTDEVRDIAKKDALNMLAERCEKTLSREDGYRFSPSRCFLYGSVRALIDTQNNDELKIVFSEADRKPSVQEIIASRKYGV